MHDPHELSSRIAMRSPPAMHAPVLAGGACLRSTTPTRRSLSWLEPDAAGASRRTSIPRAQDRKPRRLPAGLRPGRPTTTARISCGSARAIRALSMSTASWSHRSARGRGYARRLYDDLFRHAAVAGHDRVVCEVNSSRRIRRRMAFMRHWDLSRSAPQPCMMAAERFDISRTLTTSIRARTRSRWIDQAF